MEYVEINKLLHLSLLLPLLLSLNLLLVSSSDSIIRFPISFVATSAPLSIFNSDSFYTFFSVFC